MSPELTGTFAELAALATLTTAALHALGCVAAWLLARRGVAVAGAPLNFRWLGLATFVGVGGMLALIALGSRREIAGLASLIGLSVLLLPGCPIRGWTSGGAGPQYESRRVIGSGRQGSHG